MRLGATVMMMAALLAGCMSDSPPRTVQSRARGGCVIGGCSSELCADRPVVSPCIWRAVNDCYDDATCGRQADGSCGWDMTSTLKACIAAHPD